MNEKIGERTESTCERERRQRQRCIRERAYLTPRASEEQKRRGTAAARPQHDVPRDANGMSTLTGWETESGPNFSPITEGRRFQDRPLYTSPSPPRLLSTSYAVFFLQKQIHPLPPHTMILTP